MGSKETTVVVCIDCEKEWFVYYDPIACICDDPADDAWILFPYKPMCNGICMTGADVGVPYDGIAYAHPDCELHGDPDAWRGAQ